MPHICNAECWANMIRYGQSAECNPLTAEQAAHDEAEAEGAFAFPHEVATF